MFGQLVIGPPGAGKTTYCNGISQFYNIIGRSVAIVNLDPANENVPYKPDIDISELITLDDVKQEFDLGPNGGLLYCMEYLEINFDWLKTKLEAIADKYIIIDCPGQVELFTVHNSLRNIVEKLVKMDIRLCGVNLCDSHYCVDPSKYISMLLVSLKSMLQLELPHVNILSKVDMMESYGKLAFSLEYYTQVQDLSYLLDRLDQDPFSKRYIKLSRALCDLVNEFGLVSFIPLCIEDKQSVYKLSMAIDKANGYIYGGLEKSNDSIFMTAEKFTDWDKYARDIAEKYLDDDLIGEIHENERE